MAGNQEHETALREAYPEAVQAECDGGPGQWATLTNASGDIRSVKCTGCERDEMLRRIGAFIPPRFREAIEIPQDVMDWVKSRDGCPGPLPHRPGRHGQDPHRVVRSRPLVPDHGNHAVHASNSGGRGLEHCRTDGDLYPHDGPA